MMKRAAFALLLLSACTPQAAPPQEAAAPAVETPAPPPVTAEVGTSGRYKPAPAGDITVKSPVAGARVSSPLIVEGTAVNNWFFEGQFVAELVVKGQTLIQAPAMQAGDKSWTDPGPVGFRAEMTFSVSENTEAELILSEDMPEFIDEANDIRGPARSIRIPVVLLASRP